MKLLVMISSHALSVALSDNIKILNNYVKLLDMEVDYCGISNQDDFHNYENIITFKYKIINTKFQFSKICDFITDYKSELDYDWYMKIRPDIKLLENINFDKLSKNAINSRARVYHGPAKIKYGMSVNGEGSWKYIGDCHYANRERDIILDDMIFIFHKNIIQLNAFDKVESKIGQNQNEMTQTGVFNRRKIPLNVIGIHLVLTKYNNFSGHINMK
jgi:hypothetical protein